MFFLTTTPFQYLVYGDRVKIYTGCHEWLIPTEDDQRLFGEIFFSFPHIIKSAMVMSCGEKDHEGKHYMNVELCADEELNKNVGYINLY